MEQLAAESGAASAAQVAVGLGSSTAVHDSGIVNERHSIGGRVTWARHASLAKVHAARGNLKDALADAVGQPAEIGRDRFAQFERLHIPAGHALISVLPSFQRARHSSLAARASAVHGAGNTC
jgi:hypothetical protein